MTIDMAAIEENFTYLPGDNFELSVSWTYAGAPIDISDYTASFRIQTPEDVIELTIGEGITVDTETATWVITIGYELTTDWDSILDYRFQVTAPSGAPTTIIFGKLVLIHAIA